MGKCWELSIIISRQLWEEIQGKRGGAVYWKVVGEGWTSELSLENLGRESDDPNTYPKGALEEALQIITPDIPVEQWGAAGQLPVAVAVYWLYWEAPNSLR